MNEISLKSPAKLNLGLKIGKARDDGYHSISSKFQLVDIFDTIKIQKNHQGKSYYLTSNIQDEVFIRNNIVNLAVKTLEKEIGKKLNCSIYIKKNIPIGAGLGGGSSNAAATLIGINKLFALRITKRKLQKIGLFIGADVPFFIYGKNAQISGIGEVIQKAKSESGKFLIIYPNINISTKKMFKMHDDWKNGSISNIELIKSDNDFETIFKYLHPNIHNFFKNNKYGIKFSLSGSGSAIYTKIQDLTKIKEFTKEIPRKWRFFIVEGLQYSPLV